MTKFVIGSQAEVIDEGELYTTYTGLARKLGYPDAAAESDCEDTRRRIANGDVVKLLASEHHEWDSYHDPIWVVETAHNERYLISEKGLRSLGNITVLKDESLGGIEREYREVNRKANVGERIKIVNADYDFDGKTWGYDNGEVHTVISRDTWDVNIRPDGTEDSEIYVESSEYVVLEPTDIVRINGERLRMVDRKAAVGERVIMVGADCRYYKTGNTAKVKSVSGLDIYADLRENADYYGDGNWYVTRANYRVLEPLTSAEPAPLSDQSAPDQAAEIIAKLATRVTALEQRVAALESGEPKPMTFAEVNADLAIRAREPHPNCGKVVFSRPATYDIPSFLSDQQRRDAIVERAKADVADLRAFKGTPIPNDPHIKFWPQAGCLVTYAPMHAVSYVVNRDKRTVVAIIRNTIDGHITRGIAKCAPGDVFNAHIGRAIALRRALGLEVPSDYVTCPQPTEARVGDYVNTFGSLYFHVTRNDSAESVTQSLKSGRGRILDDSRESNNAEPRKEVA